MDLLHSNALCDVLLLDFDECADDSTHNCHAHAHCINNDGSFTCKCKDGYLGDGKMTCGKKI